MAGKLDFGRFIFPAGYVFERIRTADRGLLFKGCATSGALNSDVVPPSRQFTNDWIAELRRVLEVVRKHRNTDAAVI